MAFKTTGDSFAPGDQGITSKKMGILTPIVFRGHGVLHVRYICHTWRTTLSPLVDHHILEECNSMLPQYMSYEQAIGLGLRSPDNLIFCTLGLSTDRKQRWCVD
jgi:hypothetical protein